MYRRVREMFGITKLDNRYIHVYVYIGYIYIYIVDVSIDLSVDRCRERVWCRVQ